MFYFNFCYSFTFSFLTELEKCLLKNKEDFRNKVKFLFDQNIKITDKVLRKNNIELYTLFRFLKNLTNLRTLSGRCGFLIDIF